MNSTTDGKPQPDDPDVAVQMLELELRRQRAARQATKPYRGLRAASLIFFLLIVLGTMIACYFALRDGGLERFRASTDQRSNTPAAPAQSNP